ncbi:MAG: hypothetical protein ABSB35_12040 [Bryobacteraceae bacterium]
MRFQTAADLRSSLKRLSLATTAPSETTDILAAVVTKEPDLSKVPVIVAQSKLPWIVAAALALGLVITGLMLWRATRSVDHPLTRLSVDLSPEAVTGLNITVAISPDGRRLVYPVRRPDGKQQLGTSLLDQAGYTLLPGTVGGFDAFFSPDGQWIGFFAAGELMKISVQGGSPVALCAAGNPRGASWGEDGNIVGALTHLTPLLRVPATGGTPQNLTNLAAGENTHRWPQVLPGGGAVLFTASSTNVGQENANIEVVSLKTGQIKVLHRGEYFGRYVPGGHLLYVHEGVLFGVEFDPTRLEVRGTPIPVVPDVAANPLDGGGQFAVSGTASGSGTLVYLAGKGAAQTLGISWLDGLCKMQALVSAPGVYSNPRFSPDGRKLAYQSGEDISIYDLERDTSTALTFGGNSTTPVWAPGGQHLVFRAGSAISWIRSDGAGEPQRLLEGQNARVPWSFSPTASDWHTSRQIPRRDEIFGRCRWTRLIPTTPRRASRKRSCARRPTSFFLDSRPTGGGSPTARTNRELAKSTSGRSLLGAEPSGGFRLAARGSRSGPTTAENSSMRPRITGSWSWITRSAAIRSSPANGGCGLGTRSSTRDSRPWTWLPTASASPCSLFGKRRAAAMARFAPS